MTPAKHREKSSNALPSDTPLMRQYSAIKEKYRDHILLFRLGDFYEMFGADAERASPILGITLTSRPVSPGGRRFPMCGVPHHAVDGYLAKLLAAGVRVAICDQMEDPAEAKGKVVAREVTRVVTRGTLVDEGLRDATRNNYLSAVLTRGGRAGAAFADLATGEFICVETVESELPDLFARLGVSEIVYPESAGVAPGICTGEDGGLTASPFGDWAFDPEDARRRLCEHFRVDRIEGWGMETMPLATGAAGAALAYLSETQRSALRHLSRPRPIDVAAVPLSAQVIRDLELVGALRTGEKSGSLLGLLDQTRTALGARCLRRWLLAPLSRPAAIGERLDAVEALVAGAAQRTALRGLLCPIGDLERIAAKLGLGRATPRELLALAEGLDHVPEIRDRLLSLAVSGPTASPEDTLLKRLAGRLDALPDLSARIRATLRADAPTTATEGGLIATGVDAEVDRLRTIRDQGSGWMTELQRREIERTGIPTLKVGYNRVFGYYIEVTRTHEAKVPPEYVRKQTTVNAERYITSELKEREAEILTAGERLVKLEFDLFVALRQEAAGSVEALQVTAGALGEIDALAGLAETAARRNYTRPVVDDSLVIEIDAGRHPVVEAALPAGAFVPNDTHLDADTEQIVILTGPNMSGKSTYIRQVALITILAQMGSFVPATRARIGVVDRVFTRIGAGDQLAKGQSTFMVEMTETAEILSRASRRSLLVLDEVGRGTSTYDGVSIAWAVTEHLHDHPRLGCRTLFATHYHELTELAGLKARALNYNVAVHEASGRVTFLHKIIPGGTDRSYGVHVAELAGLPPEVIARAREILAQLEAPGPAVSGAPVLARRPRRRREMPQSLFAAPPRPSETLDELRSLDPQSLTPMQALLKLDALHRKAVEEG